MITTLLSSVNAETAITGITKAIRHITPIMIPMKNVCSNPRFFSSTTLRTPMQNVDTEYKVLPHQPQVVPRDPAP